MTKSTLSVLTAGLLAITAIPAGATTLDSEPGSLGAVKSTGAPSLGLESLRFGYALGNYLGSSTFIGRPQFRQTLQLSSSYQLTPHETVSATLGGRGELFTATNGSMDRVFLSDSNLSLSSSRLPQLSISDEIEIRFSPSVSYSIPISQASRNVATNWGRTSVSGAASTSFAGISASLSTSMSYTFYKYTHFRFANKEEGDRTQEGSTLMPLNLGLNAALGYAFGDVSTRMSYGFYKSRSYENNAGNAYWRDYASFSLSASYPVLPYLRLSSGYQYGADPLDGQGDIRIPFWSFYADYRNRSKIFFNISGSFAPFQS